MLKFQVENVTSMATLSQELLGDGLHPTATGLITIADCLLPLVNKLAASNATVPAMNMTAAAAQSSFQDQQGT